MEYTELTGNPVGRDWNTAMMALMRCRDKDLRIIAVYYFEDEDCTVAAKSADEAHFHLTREKMLHPWEVESPEHLLRLDLELFEDFDGDIRFPDFEDADGENRVYPFREALDIMLVELGWEAPFIFTEQL